MFASFVGRTSQPVINVVEKGAVKKFAEAIGDVNPLYYDEEFARTTPHGRPIAPPTFARTFDYGQIEGFALPKTGLMLGEQTFHYRRPVYVGEQLVCRFQVEKIEVKQTRRRGPLTFITLKQWATDSEGREVFVARRTTMMAQQTKN